MKLDLTEVEHELILHVLQNRLGELRQEVHHSTDSKFTDQLKETEVLLNGVIDNWMRFRRINSRWPRAPSAHAR